MRLVLKNIIIIVDIVLDVMVDIVLDVMVDIVVDVMVDIVVDIAKSKNPIKKSIMEHIENLFATKNPDAGDAIKRFNQIINSSTNFE